MLLAAAQKQQDPHSMHIICGIAPDGRMRLEAWKLGWYVGGCSTAAPSPSASKSAVRSSEH
eukprot:1159177-Pelagomonas_calceolata.AAC.7